jgi:hypothetical protein
MSYFFDGVFLCGSESLKPESYAHSFLNKLFWLRVALLLNFNLFHALGIDLWVNLKIFKAIWPGILQSASINIQPWNNCSVDNS